MIKLTMTFSKSTKNKHVYTGDGDAPAIPTLYVEKVNLPNKSEQIEVTINEKS